MGGDQLFPIMDYRSKLQCLSLLLFIYFLFGKVSHCTQLHNQLCSTITSEYTHSSCMMLSNGSATGHNGGDGGTWAPRFTKIWVPATGASGRWALNLLSDQSS